MRERTERRAESVCRRLRPAWIAALSFCCLPGCYRGNNADFGPGAFGSETDTLGPGTDADGDSSGGGDSGDAGELPEDADLIPETMSRRLSPQELDNTIRDLLGDETRPSSQFLTAPDYSPFDNDYTVQVPSRTFVESMEVLATDVADRLIQDQAALDALMPCTPAGADDAACFREFVESFGRRALRRPLSSEELERYATLQEFSTEANPYVENDFYTGVGLVVRAILQDPMFLYRLEVGAATAEDGVSKLNDHEIASKLAFLVTGTTPDDALLADADAGRLSDPKQRLEAAQRLLETQDAKDTAHRYHAMWLGYRAVPGTPELLAGWTTETNALIDRVVFDERLNYNELFTLNETFVDADLAAHYGLEAPQGEAGWVSYEGTGRSGILGHGSVLAGFSKFTDTSPTQRGIFIRERLLCSEVPSPPPEVDVDNPPSDADDPNACKEKRYQAHISEGTCQACHLAFDPIGFGLENYDIQGRFRLTEDGRDDCTITGQGEVSEFGTFSGPAELAKLLADAEVIEPCMIEHYLAYAYGRALTPADRSHVDAYSELFADLDYDFAGLMAEIVGQEVFGFKREPGE